MKQGLCLSVSALLAAALFSLPASAEESVDVTVTIANGTPVLVQQPVTVTDTDGDGVLSVCDALYLAHEAAYPDGAAGFACSETDYGISLDKLWGIANGGSYGYYVNNASALSLANPLRSGDAVYAYAFTDLTGWSDTYSYFDSATLSPADGEAFTLTLSAAGYDASWNPITLPVAGAVITLDGAATEFITDENGQVTLSFATVTDSVLSAVSDTMTLVPPVCRLTPAGAVTTTTETTTAATTQTTTTTTAAAVANPPTGDSQAIVLPVLCGAGLLAALTRRKHENR